MNVVVTGAGGFVGQALVRRILADKTIESVHAIDLDFGLDLFEDSRLIRHAGSIADEAFLEGIWPKDVDVVYHLASVPGGLTERDVNLGRSVNLDATIVLLDLCRASGRSPKFVFSSSIAALGGPLPVGGVSDETPCRPTLTYGAHKLIGEVLVADYSRRGWVDGRSVRLSGIVARPPVASGLLSAFLSDMIRSLAAGETFACPVPANCTTWLMSVPCLIDNLVHAAVMDGCLLGASRVCTLPALCPRLDEMVEAIAEEFGVPAHQLITWGCDEMLEKNFGRFPPLSTQLASFAGFKHDGSVRDLVRNALHN